MEIGLSVGADAYLNPTDHDNVHAIVNYDNLELGPTAEDIFLSPWLL